MRRLEVDVAVVGAGFGGTILALAVDRIGLRPAVLDRAVHPRFAVGESSTPTGNMILADLAERYGLDRLRPLASFGPWREAYPNVGVGRKRGFSYFAHRPGRAFTPAPDHGSELLVAASSDPYRSDTHWLRADVDAFLAGEVRRAGIPLLEGTEVRELVPGERWGIRARSPRGEVCVRSDLLVDATGAGGLLRSTGFTGTAADRELATRSRALYTHLAGLPRWEDEAADRGVRTGDHPFPAGDAALHHVLEDGWVWELRFADGRTSVGIVKALSAEAPPREQAPEVEWRRTLEPYPTLAERVGDPRPVDPPGAILRTGRLQRLAGRAAGPGWALLPHTAGFADPLHSTGIAHTLSGVERLARLLERHGASPPPAALQRYGEQVRDEVRFVDELVAPCYGVLPSFRGWTAAVKLYFAAVVRYERLRAAGRVPRFLCADETGLRRAAREAGRMAASWPAGEPPGRERIADFRRSVHDALRPYDEVGLLDPEVPRMHPHTAVTV